MQSDVDDLDLHAQVLSRALAISRWASPISELSGRGRRVIQEAPYRGPGCEEGDDEQRHRYEAAEAHSIAAHETDQFEHEELAAGRDHPSATAAASLARRMSAARSLWISLLRRITTSKVILRSAAVGSDRVKLSLMTDACTRWRG